MTSYYNQLIKKINTIFKDKLFFKILNEFKKYIVLIPHS